MAPTRLPQVARTKQHAPSHSRTDRPHNQAAPQSHTHQAATIKPHQAAHQVARTKLRRVGAQAAYTKSHEAAPIKEAATHADRDACTKSHASSTHQAAPRLHQADTHQAALTRSHKPHRTALSRADKSHRQDRTSRKGQATLNCADKAAPSRIKSHATSRAGIKSRRPSRT